IKANTLTWATSLLHLAYSFIWSQVSKQQEVLPWPIPRLRMVNGFICKSLKEISSAPGIGATSHCSAYLIEEHIGEAEHPFMKYINNSRAVPLVTERHPRYNTTIFLCFMQHVQYIYTERRVFISDFQGGETLLTDPQIITNPTLGIGLFGQGNLSTAFTDFPLQHECNKWCKWFRL
ncbi:hypothetical protein P691DRAFT_608972, partial [Macrolepiota fuliginosa MF-IS2]